ncbi:PREDICTED: leucine-rich repeat-containing G-protein coupled receptor 5-like [Priapulus caudatus]|uniref:Leucine-rich repeat-containing G-protein coupled receptor 5-like n=1 Tax=Priapulus caudatus TaxID=37621 RepID=A0ABM1F910_PRICU|nr:PREDICTED: leucine-rich repeat-containing G-protein coupled receptor 5-like [Priapulus caudatus]
MQCTLRTRDAIISASFTIFNDDKDDDDDIDRDEINDDDDDIDRDEINDDDDDDDYGDDDDIAMTTTTCRGVARRTMASLMMVLSLLPLCLSLELTFDNVTNITAHEVKDLVNTTTLTLSGSAITAIDSDTFSGMEHLKQLTITDSSLAEVPYSALGNLKCLKTLDLSSNLIATVHSDSFVNVSNTLQHLLLDSNHIEAIPVDALRSLYNLQTL